MTVSLGVEAPETRLVVLAAAFLSLEGLHELRRHNGGLGTTVDSEGLELGSIVAMGAGPSLVCGVGEYELPAPRASDHYVHF